MAQKDILMRKTIEYLDSQGLRYSRDDYTITFSLGISSKLSRCRMLIVVNDNGIYVQAICPINASKDVYNTVVEYITRANYGLSMGCFMFDYRDGEVSFRDFLVAQESVPSIKDIERTVDMPFIMMEKYGDGLVKALMGFGDPERDIEDAEN